MLKKIMAAIFMVSFLAMIGGCNETPKSTSKKEITESERQANTDKALESRYKKSSGKVW